MSINDMVYRTKTYIAGDWDGDANLIQQLKDWNANHYLALSFVDVHEITSSSDDSRPCSIKSSLRKRLNITKTFILIVGEKTKKLRSGACFTCRYYWNKSSCHTLIDNRSFVEYECEMAVKDYNAGKLKNIVIIYNGMLQVNRDLCPDIIRNIGIHIPSDIIKDGKTYWNYTQIKNTICR